MSRGGLSVFILMVFIAVGVYSQGAPRNTVTVDVGPTIVGVAFGLAGDILINEDNNASYGLGIAAQYELQPFNELSFAVRGSYLNVDFGNVDSNWDYRAETGMGMTSFSVEGHVRYYPFSGGVFFLDAMGGYGRLMADMSGDIGVSILDEREAEPISSTLSRDYVKIGGKFGWRMSFGREGGGFTFEPSIGYYHAIGLGDTLVKQLSETTVDEIVRFNDFDDAFSIFERLVFIGGPRVSLSLGWRF